MTDQEQALLADALQMADGPDHRRHCREKKILVILDGWQPLGTSPLREQEYDDWYWALDVCGYPHRCWHGRKVLASVGWAVAWQPRRVEDNRP